MLASRNQMNVMSRGFGNTPNGSMEAYGAAGEMTAYLNGTRHTSMRALGSGHTGPKPNFSPKTKGQVMDSQEISTKSGWSVVYVVKDRNGYYVVEHYCPKSNMHKIDGKYPNMDEAKTAANKITFQLRNTGVVKGISGLNGYSQMGGGFFSLDNKLLWGSAIVMYIGADMPGARPVLKKVSKVLQEPKGPVSSAMMFIGLAGVSMAIYQEAYP